MKKTRYKKNKTFLKNDKEKSLPQILFFLQHPISFDFERHPASHCILHENISHVNTSLLSVFIRCYCYELQKGLESERVEVKEDVKEEVDEMEEEVEKEVGIRERKLFSILFIND